MTNPAKITGAIDMNCEYLGIPGILLMENAGKEIARECSKFNNIAIFCGTGNNGGDGLVAARHLSGAGKKITVYLLAGNRTEEAQKNLEIVGNLKSIKIEYIKDSTNCEKLKGELEEVDVIIDALIGVGIHGHLREPIRSIVRLINSTNAFKLSVDVPTGDENIKVNADTTLSFHLPKIPGAKVVDIGIPREAELYCGPGDVYLALPHRRGGEHKGDFGRLLVIGGSKEYFGAPQLVAKAALQTGVDLVTISCPEYVAERVDDPSLIVNPLDSKFYLTSEDMAQILSTNFDAIVLGNGISTKKETRDLVRDLIKGTEKPILLDADALKLIEMEDIKPNVVVTPHSTEFKLLFESPGSVETVEKFAKKTKGVILMKGKTDIISDGEKTRLNRTGNPGMTVGGTGDVLAGIIGALLAMGTDRFQAACAGAFLCGLAGDIAYEDLDYCFTPMDVIDYIPDAIKFCRGV